MLEIACFNPASVHIAAKAGADRIELCADYAGGGVTPTLEDYDKAREGIDKPINIMIRPRTGNFVYSHEEFEQMKNSIRDFQLWADGFVFGILDSENRVNEAQNRELVELCRSTPCTFHRAIDDTPDLDEAMEAIIRCGFKSVLTSGGEKTAVEGSAKAAQLQQKYGSQISIILGGGVRSTNVEQLKTQTGVPWVHSAAITTSGEQADAEEVTRLQEVLQRISDQT